MRALWLEDGTPCHREDVVAPRPGPGEALVRGCLTGVCGIGLQPQRRDCPSSGGPGHEFVGTVESGPSAPAWEGRPVVDEVRLVGSRGGPFLSALAAAACPGALGVQVEP